MTLFERTAFSGIIVVSLSACSPDVDQPQAAAGAETVGCALAGSGEFVEECLVERVQVEDQTILTVRHPDGGFQRFEQLTDGRGLVEADGADVLIRSLEDDVLEVTVGKNRYRFNARAQSADASAK